MSNKNEKDKKSPDEFDILSSVWILASNDENPIMTYKSILYRLGLDNDYEIKSLISEHGELFRRGIPLSRLDRWKKQMEEYSKLPSWIRDIEDPVEKQIAIDSLTTDDLFRSQFRAEIQAPRSPIEIIDWGLRHIDRLRQANLEARRQNVQIWGIWVVLIVGVLNLIITIISAT